MLKNRNSGQSSKFSRKKNICSKIKLCQMLNEKKSNLYLKKIKILNKIKRKERNENFLQN